MQTSSSPLQKQTANLGVAWETSFGYTQAVKVKDTIYISGQLSHDLRAIVPD